MSGHAMAQVVSRWALMRRPGFAPGSIHVEFVVDKVALGQVSLQVLRFSPVIRYTISYPKPLGPDTFRKWEFFGFRNRSLRDLGSGA
jgi:hypothetical protein